MGLSSATVSLSRHLANIHDDIAEMIFIGDGAVARLDMQTPDRLPASVLSAVRRAQQLLRGALAEVELAQKQEVRGGE